jgi:hypothetical protein
MYVLKVNNPNIFDTVQFYSTTLIFKILSFNTVLIFKRNAKCYFTVNLKKIQWKTDEILQYLKHVDH